MKQFFNNFKKLHIWLLADLGLLAAYLACRHERAWMNALAEHVTGPFKVWLGRLCYRTEVSVMEVLCVLTALVCAAYLVGAIIAVIRAERGCRGRRAYALALFAADVGLTVWLGFCLLWGVNYWADSFQDKSGLRAEPVAQSDLLAVTEYFANQLTEAADDVARDEQGLFAVPRADILAGSVHAYDAVEQLFPFLAFDDPGVKAMRFSRVFSALDFTGFYCPYTGESNVNVDSPACTLPTTVAHELAHQRGIASERECNFLGILASTTCGDPAYGYAGWLVGFIHVGNALYRADPETYWTIRETLPDTVQADLAYHRAYWDQFRDKPAQQVSNKVYDGLLKTYGDENGMQSYGMVVDLLVAYYKDRV